MKRTTILAVAVLVAVAILAVWLSGENDVIPEQSMPSVVDFQPLPTSVADESEPEPVTESTAAPVEAALPAQGSSTEPVRLFSSPDYGSIEYLDAMNNANRHLANSRRLSDTRSIQLLKRNEAAIDELVRQLRSNPDRLSTAFEISPANLHACTISSIEDRSPDFTPGVLTPSSFSVETTCIESGNGVTVTVDNSETGTVGFAIRSVHGGVSILSVDESGYAVAFQRYPFVPGSE